MDKKKFFQSVRQFRTSFKHPRVSELSVDEEYVCFVYTAEGSTTSTYVSLDLSGSPKVTHAYVGDKEMTFKEQPLSDVVDAVLQG